MRILIYTPNNTNNSTMQSITAQELKVKGAKILLESTKDEQETIISVRGTTKLVVLTPEYFQKLKDYELQVAFESVQADLAQGNFKVQSPEQHLADLV
jgi:PHD/YefM family antitoxin component YafN of YafNO toxin-antitoxin module